MRSSNSQQVLRLFTSEGIQGISKHKNSTITLRKWQRINLKESYINNSNLNYQGLSSNGYFVLMCQKFLLNKTKKKVGHYYDFELISSCFP